MKLKDFGEKRLINEIVIPMFKDNILGVGDDAAIIDFGLSKDIVVSVDFVAEKLIAFEKGLMNFYDLGAYTATSNISDIVSMGAQPVALLLSMAMKEDLSINEFKDFLCGAKDLCHKFNVKVVGGDIGNTTINLFAGVALGVIEKGRYLLRNGFGEGDLVCTTGYIGLFSTALAYYLISRENKLNDSDEKIIIAALVKPEPKVWQSRLLSEHNCCTACQDITDGFSATIHEMTQRSIFKFKISEHKLPIHDVTMKVAKLINYNPVDICFGPGSGFELLFTISRDIPYLYYENQKNECFIMDAPIVESQFIRKLIAVTINAEDRIYWSNSLQIFWIIDIIQKMKPVFTKLKIKGKSIWQ